MKYTLALFCDNDKYAAESYRAIHGADPKLNIGDITQADEKTAPDFDFMFGGSPCQDFSTAGHQGGAVWACRTCGRQYNPLLQNPARRGVCPSCGASKLDMTRSSLLVEWLRFLREKRPRLAIYENVKNITGKRFKVTFDLFIAELESYGYNVYWKVLNAKDYGVPQSRERVYVVAIRKDWDNGKFHFPDPEPLDTAMQDLLEDEPEEKYYLSQALESKVLNALRRKRSMEKAHDQ